MLSSRCGLPALPDEAEGMVWCRVQRLDGSDAYAKYLVLTEAMLATALRACDSRTLPPQLRLLWRQLVVTANNFAVRAIEAGQ